MNTDPFVAALNELNARLQEATNLFIESMLPFLMALDSMDEAGGALIEELIPEAVAEWKAVRDEI